MKRFVSAIFLFLLLFTNLDAKPPRQRERKLRKLGVTLWSELGKRALIHHARKRLNDVHLLDHQSKEQYMKEYAKATVAIILYEFASGTGPTTRYFYDNEPFTEEFKTGPAMNYVLDCYYNRVSSDSTFEPIQNGRYQFSPTVIPYRPETWGFALKQHFLTLKEVNMSQFVLGSFNFSVNETKDHKLQVHVWNTTSRRSLFLGIPNRVQRPLLLGNVYQHIYMELDADEIAAIRRN